MHATKAALLSRAWSYCVRSGEVPKAGSRLDASQPPSTTRVDPNLQIGLDIPPRPSPPGEATKISGHRGCTNANLFGRGWRVRAPIFPHGNAIFGPGLRIQMRPWPVVSNRSHGGGRDTGKGRKFNELWKGR